MKIINLKIMNRLFVSILFLVLVYSQVNYRLSIKGNRTTNSTTNSSTQKNQTTLLVDQSITSTLGLFRATLRKTNCSLEISAFNETAYVTKGTYFSPEVTRDCSHLQVQQGRLVTSFNQNFMWVGQSFNESTIFTIDDLGVMRLIGTYIKLNRVDQESFEANVTNFYTVQKYIYAGTNLNIRFQDSFGPLKNQRGWTYIAEFGQLDTYYDQNPSMLKSYVYSRFKFSNSQIQDFNSDTFPSAIFSNITFEPRCFEPRAYLNFKPPFIIMADPYWPRMAVIEQGGYKVFQSVYAKMSQFTYQQNQRDISYLRLFSVCPDQTFEHKGKCLTVCPQPYFHQMRGQVGSCRLICEQFTPIDTKNRICTCMSNYEAPKYNSEMIKSCPGNTQKYPYGCFCKTAGTFFDKKLSFSCVSTCPQSTFPHSGLCVNCPNNCLTCGVDNFSRMFLQCRKCQNGYDLNDGQCFKSCNSNLGNSRLANGSCVACQDNNCVDCSENPAICKKCNLLFALSNGKCLQSCPTNTTEVPAQFFNTQCLPKSNQECSAYLTSYYKNKPYLKCDECRNGKIAHLDGCVTTCPANFKRFSFQGYNYCSCVSGVTIDNQCMNITGCPIKMYYDTFSDSCLTCPFGCISCRGSSVCTSCYPGYFLYVSPQAIICRRKSPLFACDDQYSIWNGICLVKQFQTLQMTQCRSAIPNCRVCPFQTQFRATVCVVCQQGFYIYRNNCTKTCPQNFIVYQNSACVLSQIQNCEIPHLLSTRQSSILNISNVQKSKPYQYYIFKGIQPANDPVGYIPYFQKITRRVTDGLYRENSFFQPSWTCLKCKPGFGLSDDFIKCIPCPKPCVTCFMAKSTSCLLINDTSTNLGCQGFIEYSTKQCIKSCNSTNSFPELQNGALYCKTALQSRVNDFVRIDSAIYAQSDGTKIAYFVFQNQIPQDSNITVRMKKIATSTSRLLAQEYIQKVVQVQNKHYFQVLSQSDENVFIADFTSSIMNLKSVEGYYPPNLVYGSTSQNTHPQFMKTWLSIIGQIMSIVAIAMHCIYVGNGMLYKMDNLLILMQTVYYFSFVKILVGRLLAQFYYGWIFTHLGYFPNFFTTPNQYRENAAPISYKLATTDANFIRNAGYSISIFLVFICGWIVFTALAYLISKVLHRKQVWHPNIAKSSLIAGIQIFSMNIMYWAIAHFMYRDDCHNCDMDYFRGSLAWAIIFTALIWGYAIIRFFFNPIGGLYMAKRLLIAIILPAAFDDLRFIAPIVILEIVFVVFRFIIERPQLKKQKLYILIEFGAMLLVYLLVFLCTNAGVNTIIISIVMFLFIVALMSDYMQLYLESINEWQLEPENKQWSVKSGIERAHTDEIIQRGSEMREIHDLREGSSN